MPGYCEPWPVNMKATLAAAAGALREMLRGPSPPASTALPRRRLPAAITTRRCSKARRPSCAV